jgi:hypothetical protein
MSSQCTRIVLFWLCLVFVVHDFNRRTNAYAPSIKLNVRYLSHIVQSKTYKPNAGLECRSSRNRGERIIRYNFFKKLLDQAFTNDDNLSDVDKRKGMLEGPGEEDVRSAARNRELTETQKAWRQRQEMLTKVTNDDLIGRTFAIDLYLTGVPNKDPSNDLYGSRTNISSRDRSVGSSIPASATITDFIVQFLADNKCEVVSDNGSGFAVKRNEDNDEMDSFLIGDWKLSDDGTQVRFRFGVNGYKRTIETKGTIQKVFWSADEVTTSRTSTVYSIPRGWLYGESKLRKISIGGDVDGRPRIDWDDSSNILKIEQTSGLMGVATKMIPCGKFKSKTG